MVTRQRVEQGRDLARNARAHQDMIHAREHRTVQRGGVRQLHLGEQVDADDALVPLLGEEDLRECCEHGDQLARA